MAVNRDILFDGITNGAAWDAGVVFNRTNGIPIDKYSVFETDKAASDYALNNPVAYPGQYVAVVAENGTVQAYIIGTDGSLEEFGGKIDLPLSNGEGENSLQSVNSKALSANAVALGAETSAGGKGFEITGVKDTSAETGKETGEYTLNSVKGLEVNMKYAAVFSPTDYSTGTITAIDNVENVVTVKGYKHNALNKDTDIPAYNSFLVVDTPELGDKDVGLNAYTEGQNTMASGFCSHAEGNGSIASGFYSFAFGDGAKAGDSGARTCCFSFGQGTHAKNSYSVAFGNGSTTNNGYSMSFGGWAHTHGLYSLAFGLSSATWGSYSLAFGSASESSGIYSLAFGNTSQTTSTAQYSFAFGASAIAGGSYSLAFGDHVYAAGEGAVALGASIQRPDFVGDSGEQILRTYYTSASGTGAFACGQGSTAQGDYSVACGQLVYTRNPGEVAFGRCNTSLIDKTIFTIGNGELYDTSNLFQINQDGAVYLADLKSQTVRDDALSLQEQLERINERLDALETT